MAQDDESLADDIASASIAHYSALPKHGKPQIRSNGVPEWTILATICLVEGTHDPLTHSISVISLGTGVKCLPANKLPPCGDTLHDSHAEVLARRGLIWWLLQQAKISDGPLVLNPTGRLSLRRGLQLWLYVSTLPCGDASTLHTAAHQPADMAALKNSEEGQKQTHTVGSAIRGRNGYEAFGAIRTKPGRADSVPSISLSCSDKIASWSVLGLQGALLAKYFDPVYLGGIVIGGIEEPPSTWPLTGKWRETIRCEVRRAVYGRLEQISDHLEAPYSLHRPKVHLTSVSFPFARDQIVSSVAVPSVTSLLHLPFLPASEVLFNGCRAATWKAPGHKVLAEKNRSAVCKLEMMRAVQDLGHLGAQESSTSPGTCYYDLKHSSDALAYQTAKAVLRGVPADQTSLDPAFGKTGPFQITTAIDGSAAPFRGWIVSGRRFETFTEEGVYIDGIDAAG